MSASVPAEPKGRVAEMETTILETARDLLAECGLDALSMRGLAERVGVSATAIYHYFANKQDLVDRVVEQGFRRFSDYLKKAMDAHPSGSMERLAALGEAYSQFAFDHRQYYKVIFNIQTSDPRAIEEFPGHGGYNLLRQSVEECIASGAIRRDDPDLISLYLWCVAHGLVTLAMACRVTYRAGSDGTNHPGTPAEFMRLFGPLIASGVRAEGPPMEPSSNEQD